MCRNYRTSTVTTKDSGKMEDCMASAVCTSPTDPFTLGLSKTTRPTEKASTCIPMARTTRGRSGEI